MSKKLVAFFSASGTTKKVAQMIADAGNYDLYEITPKVAYTKADLNWMDKKSRSSVEMNDKKFRPEIEDKDANIAEYDEIILGFPIWWYVAPTIVNTFLEKFDFSGKKVVLFAIRFRRVLLPAQVFRRALDIVDRRAVDDGRAVPGPVLPEHSVKHFEPLRALAALHIVLSANVEFLNGNLNIRTFYGEKEIFGFNHM